MKTARCYDYNRRRGYEERSRYRSYPLPCRTLEVTKQHVITAVTNRRRQTSYYVTMRSSRTLCALLLLAVIGVVSYWVCLLLEWTGNGIVLSQWYCELCSDLWRYSELSSENQLRVTNHSFALLVVNVCVFILLYTVLAIK